MSPYVSALHVFLIPENRIHSLAQVILVVAGTAFVRSTEVPRVLWPSRCLGQHVLPAGVRDV